MPSQVGSSAISCVHWVIARTKTRSKKSSSGVTGLPRASPDSPGARATCDRSPSVANVGRRSGPPMPTPGSVRPQGGLAGRHLALEVMSATPAVHGDLDAWRALPAAQQPDWPDPAQCAPVAAELAAQPPLVFAGECDQLKERLAAVAARRGVRAAGRRLRRDVRRRRTPTPSAASSRPCCRWRSC